jgi:hypothetical protein
MFAKLMYYMLRHCVWYLALARRENLMLKRLPELLRSSESLEKKVYHS